LNNSTLLPVGFNGKARSQVAKEAGSAFVRVYPSGGAIRCDNKVSTASSEVNAEVPAGASCWIHAQKLKKKRIV
jgi:hypothetical protein